MSIALIADCVFPGPPVRVQLSGVTLSSARVRQGISFKMRCSFDLMICPPGLLVVPDVQRDVDVILVVVIDALDSFPKVCGAYPAAFQLSVRV